MVGKTFTYLLGSDAAALLFNSKNEDLNAEDVYSRLTTPVFGKGVAYDVPNPVCVLSSKSVKHLGCRSNPGKVTMICLAYVMGIDNLSAILVAWFAHLIGDFDC